MIPSIFCVDEAGPIRILFQTQSVELVQTVLDRNPLLGLAMTGNSDLNIALGVAFVGVRRRHDEIIGKLAVRSALGAETGDGEVGDNVTVRPYGI